MSHSQAIRKLVYTLNKVIAHQAAHQDAMILVELKLGQNIHNHMVDDHLHRREVRVLVFITFFFFEMITWRSLIYLNEPFVFVCRLWTLWWN